ncbi:MAG: hypothetical protein LQ345_006628 [Seirophora villosa]|nr:MAG: hypothetical protein LQ345_006628 [Seirophora villosa]
MAGGQKRKGRWSSRSFFGLITSRKKVIGESSVPGVGDATTESREPNLGFSNALSDSNFSSTPSSTAEKIRRHGSRLLSIVRMHGSASSYEPDSKSFSKITLTVTTDISLSEMRTPPVGSPSVVSADRFEETEITGSNTTPTNKDAVPISDLKNLSRAHSSDTHPASQIPAAFDLSASAEDSKLMAVKASCKSAALTGPRRIRSIPSIAHQLPHQLSNALGTQTVVHRVNQRTRPGMLSLYEHLPSDVCGLPKFNTQSSTDPSSYGNSSGVFIGGRSTGKTSLGSNVASLNTQRNKDRIERFERLGTQGSLAINQAETRDTSLTPIEEKPEIVVPTIVTAESAANAKIFFETYFNALLSNQKSPRSYRRHELEARLRTEAFTADQCERERAAWVSNESEQLRRYRVLKSKPNRATGRSGVSLAGFEVVKVLGKGSFGVVRLVRQRDSTHDEHPLQSPTTSAEQVKGILRTTLDSQRAFQRREVKKTKEVYAMKVIRKSDMLRNSQEGHLRAERDFLVSSEKSRWVVPLIASFQDRTNLYLVMDYMVGGDFLGLLFRKDILKEKKARWYVAEMILCIEEAHRLRWIHRDVKPDNFLISASGHLKISDFGLAFDGHWTHDQSFFNNHRQSLMERLGIEVKGDSLDRKEGEEIAAGLALANAVNGRKSRRQPPQTDGPSENEDILEWRNKVGNRKLARSVVGTSQYMAPEVIRGDHYDGRCDWWSIGIILYEVDPLVKSSGPAPNRVSPAVSLRLYSVCLRESDSNQGKDPGMCISQDICCNRLTTQANATTLRFPPDTEPERKEKVSELARDLINCLLQEKQHRLCSPVYRQNDYQITHLAAGRTLASRANKESQDYKGHFVYANDATEIKTHPFFYGLSWERLHLSRPPFVPDVKGRDDTKYFDEEEPVSDVDDASTTCSVAEQDTCVEASKKVAAAFFTTQLDGGLTTTAVHGIDDAHGALPHQLPKTPQTAKTKEKRRPRDRALRDKDVGRTVLELRKKGAFPGYTYRRPRLPDYDEERGRQVVGRRSMLPSMS